MKKMRLIWLLSFSLVILGGGVTSVHATDITLTSDQDFCLLIVKTEIQALKVEILHNSEVLAMENVAQGLFQYEFTSDQIVVGDILYILVYFPDSLVTKLFTVDLTPPAPINFDVLGSNIFSVYIPIALFTFLVIFIVRRTFKTISDESRNTNS